MKAPRFRIEANDRDSMPYVIVRIETGERFATATTIDTAVRIRDSFERLADIKEAAEAKIQRQRERQL